MASLRFWAPFLKQQRSAAFVVVAVAAAAAARRLPSAQWERREGCRRLLHPPPLALLHPRRKPSPRPLPRLPPIFFCLNAGFFEKKISLRLRLSHRSQLVNYGLCGGIAVAVSLAFFFEGVVFLSPVLAFGSGGLRGQQDAQPRSPRSCQKRYIFNFLFEKIILFLSSTQQTEALPGPGGGGRRRGDCGGRFRQCCWQSFCCFRLLSVLLLLLLPFPPVVPPRTTGVPKLLHLYRNEFKNMK